jgi:uncharacterized spore protein YtfJ
MNVDELMQTARDSLTVRRVYGDPVERGGLTVIPAASVSGGFGGGEGTDPKGQEGKGGGFGMTGRPAGVYVLRDGDVTWRPAVDVNKVIAVTGLVIVTYLLTRPRLVRVRAAAAAAE